jgi:hypothetical protein
MSHIGVNMLAARFPVTCGDQDLVADINNGARTRCAVFRSMVSGPRMDLVEVCVSPKDWYILSVTDCKRITLVYGAHHRCVTLDITNKEKKQGHVMEFAASDNNLGFFTLRIYKPVQYTKKRNAVRRAVLKMTIAAQWMLMKHRNMQDEAINITDIDCTSLEEDDADF